MSFPSIEDYPFFKFQQLVRSRLGKEIIVKKSHHDIFLAELKRLNPNINKVTNKGTINFLLHHAKVLQAELISVSTSAQDVVKE